MKVTVIPIVIGVLGTVTKGLVKGLESGGYLNDSTVEIGQNAEKSPEDLRRLGITQIPVKDHQLMMVWKTLKGIKWYL